MRLTRRSVLTIPAVAIVRPASATTLRVEPTDDGGFRVLGAEPAWGQTGAELRAALGEGARADIAHDLPQVTLLGALAGATVQLRLSFGQSGTALTVATRGRVGRLGRGFAFEGQPRPFPLLLDGRVEANAFARGLGLNPSGANRLTLDATLALRLISLGGFAFGSGLQTMAPLRLLPSAGGNGPLAIIEQPALSGRHRLGERGAAAFNLEPRPDRLLVTAADGGVRHLRLEGGGRLAIAEARLDYGPTSTIRFAATGSGAGAWWLDLLLPLDAQRVDTPEGRVELSGTGGSDIVAEGGAGRVRAARAEAVLRHAALRLPLQASGRGYADLGRLDFAASTRVTLAILETDADESALGRVPLAPGAGPMRLSLDTADLWAGRDADMFRARFGFRGLDLVVRRRTAVLRSRPGAGDEKTILVYLPSQHIMEQAFPRVAPRLPGRGLRPEELPSAFDVDARSLLADQLSKEKDSQAFNVFRKPFKDRYEKLCQAVARPPAAAPYPSARTVQLEKIYVGPDGLITPLGRRAARETAQSLAPAPKLDDVPLGLGEIVVSDLLRRHGLLGTGPADPVAAAAVLKELLEEAAKRQTDMASILGAWRRDNPTKPLLLAAWRTSWPAALRDKGTSAALVETLKSIPIAQATSALEDALLEGYRSRAPNDLPVDARAAGETRLAFTPRLPTNGTLPWSLATLLDWGAMDLRVSRRAETRFVPASSTPAGSEHELSSLLSQQLDLRKSNLLGERLEKLREILRRGPDDTETAIELPARLILSPDSGTLLPPEQLGRPQKARFIASAAPRARAGWVPLWRADLEETPGVPYSLRAIHTQDYNAYALTDPAGDPLHHPERGMQAGRRLEPPEVFALDDFDRRQIVALSSLYGLPALARRGAGGVVQTSQVSPPDDFRITDGLYGPDAGEQAMYVPRPLPSRLMRLTALGGTLDLEAPFVPPAPVRAKLDDAKKFVNIFDAYSLERVRILIALGREVTTEVVYKGFLYPLGFRAALLKVTERRYLPWPGTYDIDASGWRGPVAFEVQRFFIQVANPEKTYPGIGQPFAGRAWPARALTMLTQTTPDLLDPTRSATHTDSSEWQEELNGRLDQAQRSGLVFWPRTAPGEGGNVRFRFALDGRPEAVSMPLIFMDNQAAHDAPTMRELQRYWNDPEASPQRRSSLAAPSADLAATGGADTKRAWEALRRIEHAGVRRRYAEEDVSGDTTFETLSWDVRVDSREAALRPRFLPREEGEVELAGEPPSMAWQMNAAMESDDQPPFYPRCLQATIRHDGIAQFTGNPQPEINVRFLHDYVRTGLPVLLSEEFDDKGTEAIEQRQAEVLAAQRLAATEVAAGRTTASDPRREAFLRITDTIPQQTMGRNGVRAAGVMRPEMRYSFIGRKGPIGGAQLTTPSAVPATVNQDFVLVDARICGLVSLQEILKEAQKEATEVAAPLLRQTIEYGFGEVAGQADATAKAFAYGLRPFLQAVLTRFKGNAQDAQMLRAAYGGAYSAMGRLDTALDKMANQGFSALSEVVTAGGDVRTELDRLAANPLAPLTNLGEQRLSTIRDEIKSAASAALNNAVPTLQLEALSQALRDAFAPLGEALFALDVALDELQPPPSEVEGRALRDHAARAFARVTDGIFAPPPNESLPKDLKTLRSSWRERVGLALDADPMPDVPAARLTLFHTAIRQTLAAVGGVSAPPVLDRFYIALRAFISGDWRGALNTLDQVGVRRLHAWVGSRLDDACSAAGTKVAVAAQRLRDALLAAAIPRPCEPTVCSAPTPPSAAAEICARLWALCARNELHNPAAAVGEALARLETAVSAFGQGDPCKPSPVEGAARLTAEIRRLDAARAAFGTALATLLTALGKAAQQQMEDAAASEAAVLAAALLALLRPAPTGLLAKLRLAPGAFDQLQSALEPALGAEGANAAVTLLRDADQTVGLAQDALEKAKDAASVIQALAKLGDSANPTKALIALIEAGRAAVEDLVFAAALPAAQVADDAAKRLLDAMYIYLTKAKQLRAEWVDMLRPLDQQLDLRGEEQLTALLYIDFGPPPFPELPSAPITGEDKLDRECKRIDSARNADATGRANELAVTVPVWFFPGGGGSSVDQIIRNLGDRLLAAARHKLVRVLDVDDLRVRLQEALAKLVPARRRLDYAWALPAPAKTIDLGIVTFKGGGFQVNAASVLDLLEPAKPVTGLVSGSIGDFEIGIQLDKTKLLTLFFTGVGFEAAPGTAARVDEPRLKRFEPSGSLLFLAGLAAYCKLQGGDPANADAAGSVPGVTPTPNGIYTVPRPGGGAGIRSGYGLSFGALQIGTMAVLDVVFDAHVELPFDGDPGHAQLSLSTPEKPATLVCAPYGGTAYARLQSVARIGKSQLATNFDVAFQFGGAVAISFGILQGSGRVMTGLRVFEQGDGPGFSALFVAAFEGHIACFGIAASFVLALSYSAQGRLSGTAALTYSFSVGPVKKSFTVHVTRDAGKGLENNTVSLEPPVWGEPRIMVASASSGGPTKPARPASLRADVPGMMQDWPRYVSRYANPRHVLGKRRRA